MGILERIGYAVFMIGNFFSHNNTIKDKKFFKESFGFPEESVINGHLVQAVFEAYKRASQNVYPIPPSLMVLLARCYISPGTPPISQEEAENLLREALKKEKTIEGVSLIRRICERKQDMDQVAYWDKVLQQVQAQGSHIHDIQPSFLKNLVGHLR
jgi:hypothetical protein